MPDSTLPVVPQHPAGVSPSSPAVERVRRLTETVADARNPRHLERELEQLRRENLELRAAALLRANGIVILGPRAR